MAVDRRKAFGDAAVRVIGRGGMRSLTHRSVDEAAGLPPGSVNYYAPTRAKLLQLALNSVLRQTMDIAVASFSPALETRNASADVIVDCTVDFIMAAADEARDVIVARNVLVAEAQFDPDLLDRVMENRERFVEFGNDLLRAAGQHSNNSSAPLLISIVDGLIYQQSMVVRPPLPRALVRVAIERAYGLIGSTGEGFLASDGDPGDETEVHAEVSR